MGNFKRTATGAIINTNEIELKNARLKKEIKNKKKDRIEELENRIEILEADFQALELKFREYIYMHTDDGK